MRNVVISVAALDFTYSDEANESRPLFENLCLEVERGEIVCLVGPSGCGKTTLLNLIAGFLKPLSGVIRVSPKEQSSNGVGYIFQHDALLPWRTVKGNLSLANELYEGKGSQSDERKIIEYLKLFNLDESVLTKYPSELSGGMRQRVSIVQSLMSEPDILLLDEPFSSLDFFTKLKLETEFRRMVTEKNKAALFVTHDIDEAVAMGDRILVMGNYPCGVQKELIIEFDTAKRLSPEAIRGHARFGEYFSLVWSCLRANV